MMSIEYGGLVKNQDTGEYEMLYRTEFSALLARNRAIEEAGNRNRYCNKHFDVADVIIKKRTMNTVVTYGEWEFCDVEGKST